MVSSRCVVLLSGGIDSTTLLAERIQAGRTCLPVSFYYGQRHDQELNHALGVAAHYGLPRPEILDLMTIVAPALVGAGSSQLGEVPVPHGHYADESMKVTVVPNRNMIMLAIATAYAITHDAAEVAYAAHAGDHAIYPDCRPEFAKAMRQTMALCDYPSRAPLLVTPFIHSSKADIVRLGSDLGVPYFLTYSCYEGKAAHCGRCGTCVERKEAFTLAGVEDPTLYTYTEDDLF